MYGYYSSPKTVKEIADDLEKTFGDGKRLTGSQVHDWVAKHYPDRAFLLAPEVIGYIWRFKKNRSINVFASDKTSSIPSKISRELKHIANTLRNYARQN